MGRLIASGRARLIAPAVRDAAREAEAVRARAHEDAARIAASARRDGLSAGEAMVVGKMLELATHANELRDGASREVATLALDVASRIVGEAVAIDAGLVERIVARALARARDESRVVLALHPEDRAALEARLGALPDTIQLVDAPDQLRGGCVVSSERLRIDARVESAIEAIARAMGVDAPGR